MFARREKQDKQLNGQCSLELSTEVNGKSETAFKGALIGEQCRYTKEV